MGKSWENHRVFIHESFVVWVAKSVILMELFAGTVILHIVTLRLVNVEWMIYVAKDSICNLSSIVACMQ